MSAQDASHVLGALLLDVNAIEEDFVVRESFYFDLLEPGYVPSAEPGGYIVVCHLWEVTEDRPAITDAELLSCSEQHVHDLRLKSTKIGLPGWEGELGSPAENLAWFVDNGFYIFAKFDGKRPPANATQDFPASP